MLKILRNSWQLWTILAVLLLIIGLLKSKGLDEQKPVHNHKFHGTSKFLIPDKIDGIGAIEIVISQKIHRYQKNDKNIWFFHMPHAGHHKTHSHDTIGEYTDVIAGTLTGFGRTQKERNFSFDLRKDEYGVVNSNMYILIFKDPNDLSPDLRISVGDVAPDTLSRYILVKSQVFTIANFHIEKLLNLVNITEN
ncbi:MAG: hypothetical protein CMK56_02005 [Proteobacteria bacterium]|nr:hypothetical protein [Pseudomonadota bacterium]